MSRTVSALRRLDPASVAAEISTSVDDPWTQEFLRALDARVRSAPLERLLATWDLSAAAAGRVFGVTRQAVSKWRGSGVPDDRAVALADLVAATDVLERYVRRERIPAVVRRPAEVLGGRSLLQLAEEGRYAEVRAGVARMLDLRRVQP
ncbi:MAG: hypothetical protein LCI03_09630 [Actinobacteria bacterium]|nr:hypothetical protein [Actinomycetota bacterium]